VPDTVEILGEVEDKDSEIRVSRLSMEQTVCWRATRATVVDPVGLKANPSAK